MMVCHSESCSECHVSQDSGNVVGRRVGTQHCRGRRVIGRLVGRPAPKKAYPVSIYLFNYYLISITHHSCPIPTGLVAPPAACGLGETFFFSFYVRNKLQALSIARTVVPPHFAGGCVFFS